MTNSRSLRARAVMALLLMVGFYGLSLAIAGGLLWVPYYEATELERVHLRLWLFCLVGGGSLLWAIMPRIDRFEPPGPRLTPANAPYLFIIIEQVAKATSQPKPDEVYLLGDVNAFVAHRGGIMGIGSKRVMGVGLPLLKGLTPAELRSVIAHEFGHFVSGDVALGPWIYKTRMAIFRALDHVGHMWILAKLFEWYGRMFMKMTMQVSREQEFVADATAARVAGVGAAMNALKRVAVIAPAYATFFQNEVAPVFSAGYLPPVHDGFERYLADPEMARLFKDHAREMALGAEAGEFDSHPPTAQRVAAIARLNFKVADNPRDATATMLKDPERHLRALFEHIYGKEKVSALKSIKWEEVGAKVYTVMWQEMVEEHREWLGTLTADQIPSSAQWFRDKGAQLANQHNRPDATEADHIQYAKHMLLCAVGAGMIRQGWTLDTSPGRPLSVARGDHRFEPHVAIGRLADACMTAAEWKATCESYGLTGMVLAAPSSVQSRIA
jgi:Zn-dependent protease with chaperone function